VSACRAPCASRSLLPWLRPRRIRAAGKITATQHAASARVQLRKKKEQKLKFSGQSLRILSGSSYLSANEADRRCYAIHKENDAHPVENHEKLDLAAKSHPGSETLCKTCSMCLIKWATQSELQCSTAEIVHSSASQRSLR